MISLPYNDSNAYSHIAMHVQCYRNIKYATNLDSVYVLYFVLQSGQHQITVNVIKYPYCACCTKKEMDSMDTTDLL